MMRRPAILAVLMVLGFAAPMALAKNAAKTTGKRRPLVTKTCVKKDGAGVCREWDYTYGVAGATCTENCILFSALDDCKLRNQCTFDEPSGCFKKKVCTKINADDDCGTWTEQAACN